MTHIISLIKRISYKRELKIISLFIIFELRINLFDNSNIIRVLYCEPVPLFTLQAQATTPIIYLVLTLGFQTFSQSPTYIPAIYELERSITNAIILCSDIMPYLLQICAS